MLLRANANFIQFFREVRKCQGQVLFYSAAGDQLDLRSVLSQYVLSSLIGKRDLLDAGSIVCEKAEDQERLAPFCQ